MPRKPSKYVLRTELERVTKDRDLFGLGFHLLAFDLPTWIENTTYQGLRYRFFLFRPTSAHGGIVIVRTEAIDPAVSGNHVSVTYLDQALEELRQGRGGWDPFAGELTKISEARYRANRPQGEGD